MSRSVFSSPPPRLYSVAAGRAFLRDLASALRREAGDDPLALADMLIFTPTRRSARALAEAFLALASEASLLPDIRSLGDVDEDELVLDGPADPTDLPEAVSPLERRIALARLIARAEPSFSGQERLPAALSAAQELEKLLNSLYAEEISFAKLAAHVPEDLAAHWERSLRLLSVVDKAWPNYLASCGLMDPAERRARLIEAEAARLARVRPETPVVLAGSQGAQPAVLALMKTVADLPRGAVVLAGLDVALAADAKAWEAVDDPHPQMSMKCALNALGVAPDEVRPWPGEAPSDPRRALISLALRPAEATDDWRERVAQAGRSDSEFAQARNGLALIEARDEEAEAAAVAIVLRETVEAPGARAILVTPDRALARRAAAKLKRWEISVDDSAGLAFADSPCGVFLRLAAAWLAAPSDPVAALSLARHPLAGFGLSGEARLRAVNAFDRSLRGISAQLGLAGLRAKLRAAENRTEDDADSRPKAAAILAALDDAAGHWPAAGRAPFEDFLSGHLKAAEQLAADAAEAGAARLWRGEDGEVGAARLALLSEAAANFGEIDGEQYVAAFAQLLDGATVRRPEGAHPRIAVLGPLEARLQSADHIVLGGLNEGVWPAAAVDPFLPPALRRDAGLPSPERRIGLSAHDFAQLASAPRVTLTRARMSGGAPTKPSRWIVRLKNILASRDALAPVDATARLAAWARTLDKSDAPTPAPAPRPKPPFDARPRKLPVTRFENLLRDPYSVYAEYVLRLKALDPLAEPFGKRDRGLLIHATMRDYVSQGVDPEAEGARGALGGIFDELAQLYGFAGSVAAFWQPRANQALDWLFAWDRERRRLGAPALVETNGEATFAVGAAPFTLTARADRIDVLSDGAAVVFDYKSGRLPTLDQTEALFTPQLPLTALIVADGGFPDIGRRTIAGFYYVKAFGQQGEPKNAVADKNVVGADAEAAQFIFEARAGFAALVAHFDNPSNPYLSQPRPQFVNPYGKYDHLARRREWAAVGESREGE